MRGKLKKFTNTWKLTYYWTNSKWKKKQKWKTFNIFDTNGYRNITYQNFGKKKKAILREEILAIDTGIEQKERNSVNNPTYNSRNQKKKNQPWSQQEEGNKTTEK